MLKAFFAKYPWSVARRYFLLALGIVVLDQVVKLAVKLNMHLGQEYRVLGDVFKIHFIENPGAAFGLTITALLESLMHVDEITGKLVLTIFSLVLVGFIAYFLITIAAHKTWLPFFSALILGGAVGNIIDRVFYGVWFAGINDYEGGLLHGRVVDMFYLDIWQGVVADWVPIFGGQFYALWPIFNIADAAISVGIVAVLVFQRRFFAPPPVAVVPAVTTDAPILAAEPSTPPTEG